ncbi:CDP-glycerol glycerophosphotransferase family protein [Lactobacillus delbrueckii]|uniref:CDP-glycerol glycerophosphotransferase family protein n=1 Tax=Lactobacillus delbrueckii TaxID=1584 RepID=UPI003852CCE9
MKVKDIFKSIIKGIMYGLRVVPLKNDKIVFSAFSARTYGDNPKAIAEYLVKNKYNYDCVFVLDNPQKSDVLSGIRVVKYNTLRYLYEMATARVWVDNTRKQPHIVKRKGQFYIQTWHGGIFIKKIEKDAENVLDSEYVKTAINDSKNIDCFLTNSKWGENQIRRCFWYDGDIEITGSPRVDIIFNCSESKKKEIRNSLGINVKDHILLYAPTFRRDKNVECYNIDFKRITTALQTKFGGSWKVVVKLHPNIRNVAHSFGSESLVIDGSYYPDINELYCISDALITDYSSSIFDYSLTKKPAFIYATDVEEYSKDRNVHFQFKDLPYPFSENNDQLEKNILRFDQKAYGTELNNFFEKLGVAEDGHAAERVASIISTAINSK